MILNQNEEGIVDIWLAWIKLDIELAQPTQAARDGYELGTFVLNRFPELRVPLLFSRSKVKISADQKDIWREPIMLPECKCGDQRGEWGGVCHNCGNAIPTEKERG